MKIAEIIAEDLTAGAGEGSVAVGNAGADSIIMRPPAPRRRMKQIPQVGYGIKVGNMVIPTPRSNSDDDLGQINAAVGG